MPTPRHAVIRERITTGLSQEQMAQRIGIARTALIRAEDGGPIKLFTARKVAEHYGRTIPDLFPDLLEGWEQ